MANQLLMCKNPKCTNIVPESKNPGVKRIFCTARCARRYHSRLAYQRETGGTGEGMLRVDGNMKPQVFRKMPPSIHAAEARFKAHIDDCAIAARKGSDHSCPARFDVYDRKKLCLIHAVLNEDWAQMMMAEESLPFKRETTTLDGHWRSDVEEVERYATADSKHVDSDEENAAKQVAAFIEAGGGVAPVEEPAPW